MCYLIAKNFDGHGILIVTINKTEGYPEYKPYDIIDNEREFVNKVLEMVE